MGVVVCSPPPAEGGAGASDDPHQQQRWTNFDSSVNAVSFGFVATAILISMFLVMAIFERFLRPTSSSSSRQQHPSSTALPRDRETAPPPPFNPKLAFPSPKMTVYTKGVSVLMPGEDFPTYIAHPAPVACPPEPVTWPLNHYRVIR